MILFSILQLVGVINSMLDLLSKLSKKESTKVFENVETKTETSFAVVQHSVR